MSAPPDPIYRAHLNLCYIVLAQGLQDAAKDDPGALEWVSSPSFTYWCEWADIDPDRMRRRVAHTTPKARYQIRSARPGHPRGARSAKTDSTSNAN